MSTSVRLSNFRACDHLSIGITSFLHAPEGRLPLHRRPVSGGAASLRRCATLPPRLVTRIIDGAVFRGNDPFTRLTTYTWMPIGIGRLPGAAGGLRGRPTPTRRVAWGAFRRRLELRLRQWLVNMNVLRHGQTRFEVGDRLLSNRCAGHYSERLEVGRRLQGGQTCIRDFAAQGQTLELRQSAQLPRSAPVQGDSPVTDR